MNIYDVIFRVTYVGHDISVRFVEYFTSAQEEDTSSRAARDQEKTNMAATRKPVITRENEEDERGVKTQFTLIKCTK